MQIKIMHRTVTRIDLSRFDKMNLLCKQSLQGLTRYELYILLTFNSNANFSI